MTEHKLADELAALDAKATQGPWGIWREPIAGKDDAIGELTVQVEATSHIIDAMVLLDAGGQCPAITGCGPTSDANAELIVALRNNLPALVAALRRPSFAAEDARNKLCELIAAYPPDEGVERLADLIMTAFTPDFNDTGPSFAEGVEAAVSFMRERGDEVMGASDECLPLVTAAGYLHGCANDLAALHPTPAPAEDALRAKIDRMCREALADGGESGPPTIDYDTLVEIRARLADTGRN